MNKNQTQINPLAGTAGTVLNPALDNNGTVINAAVQGGRMDSLVGTILAGKYMLTERLRVSAGEADIYLCACRGAQYIAKIYRREAAIKPEILETMRSISSPYIAGSLDVGAYEGRPFEILPYYAAGSMQGQTCSFEELKCVMIPAVNEALRVLHEHGIIHKDIKPSNMMRWNDRRGISLIDFGISSVLDQGNTMIVTHTGMTPEYSAPETFRGLFLDESDYYSFGITLYELFCGYTPYTNMTADQIARYTAAQKIPFPPHMPQALQELITGLTYVDITHRNEKGNPNRRWTYQEVVNWCMGKVQPMPGAAAAAAIPAYTFMGQRYSDVSALAGALAANWDRGKRQLFRGLMSGFFKGFDPETAGYCLDAEDAAREPGANEDLIFWKLLYQIAPGLPAFFWKDRRYETLEECGRQILEKLRNGDPSDEELWDEMLRLGLFSHYAANVCGAEEAAVRALAAMETKQQVRQSREARLQYYTLGYLLSGDRTCQIGGYRFGSVNDLMIQMKELMDRSWDAFAAFGDLIMAGDGGLDPQFEAWLISQGKRDILAVWKNR